MALWSRSSRLIHDPNDTIIQCNHPIDDDLGHFLTQLCQSIDRIQDSSGHPTHNWASAATAPHVTLQQALGWTLARMILWTGGTTSGLVKATNSHTPQTSIAWSKHGHGAAQSTPNQLTQPTPWLSNARSSSAKNVIFPAFPSILGSVLPFLDFGIFVLQFINTYSNAQSMRHQ